LDPALALVLAVVTAVTFTVATAIIARLRHSAN
jgi:hypothetical protein